MKYFLLVALFLNAKKCEHKTKEPHLFLGTSQHWSGGAAGSGHGYYFNFYLQNSTATGYSFDSVWVDERMLPLTTVPATKGDTLQLSSEEFLKSEWMKKQTGDTTVDIVTPFPVMGFEGAALLGYWHNGKRGYVPVIKFSILPALNYP